MFEDLFPLMSLLLNGKAQQYGSIQEHDNDRGKFIALYFKLFSYVIIMFDIDWAQGKILPTDIGESEIVALIG